MRRSCPVHHAHLLTVIPHDRSGPACLRAGKSDSVLLPGLFLARFLSTLSSSRISAILSSDTSGILSRIAVRHRRVPHNKCCSALCLEWKLVIHKLDVSKFALVGLHTELCHILRDDDLGPHLPHHCCPDVEDLRVWPSHPTALAE